jgi:hypothetical protein
MRNETLLPNENKKISGRQAFPAHVAIVFTTVSPGPPAR